MIQLVLPGFDSAMTPQYACPLCGQVATLFGQYSPLLDWGVLPDMWFELMANNLN